MSVHRRKFIGEIPEEEMKVIELACQIEKRSRISFIRKATSEYAKLIIKNNQEASSNDISSQSH